MSPIRLLILAALGYFLFRLLRGGNGPEEGPDRPGTESPPARDTLVEDPVCHTYIPRKQAVHLKNRGVDYFFCSQDCRNRFLENKS